MYALYSYVRSFWYPVEEEKVTKKSEKWKIIKGKRYRIHPFSYFYTVFPEYENWKLAKTKKKSPPPNNTTEPENKQEVSRRKGGISFSLDFDNLHSDVKSDSGIPRRFLSTELWNCISRPQYKYACGISSLVSVWNFLFSKRGRGTLSILGFSEPYGEIRFGPFTGNQTLIKWFQQLCDHFGVRGSGSYFWSAGKTPKKNPESVKDQLKQALVEGKSAFIYHCYNHYITVLGFEETPLEPTKGEELDIEDSETWILLGDTSKTNAPIQSVKFEWIAIDLMCKSPYHVNIRHPEQGVLERDKNVKGEEEEQGAEEETKTKGVKPTNHCLLQFTIL